MLSYSLPPLGESESAVAYVFDFYFPMQAKHLQCLRPRIRWCNSGVSVAYWKYQDKHRNKLYEISNKGPFLSLKLNDVNTKSTQYFVAHKLHSVVNISDRIFQKMTAHVQRVLWIYCAGFTDSKVNAKELCSHIKLSETIACDDVPLRCPQYSWVATEWLSCVPQFSGTGVNETGEWVTLVFRWHWFDFLVSTLDFTILTQESDDDFVRPGRQMELLHSRVLVTGSVIIRVDLLWDVIVSRTA